MVVLSKYELFVEKRKIKFMCDKFALSDYTINDDLSVDVNKSVYLQSFEYNGKLLSYLPFKFGIINGIFDVSHTIISNFINFPSKLDKLVINYTNIKSLEGLPICKDLCMRGTDIKDISMVPTNVNIFANDTKLTYVTENIPIFVTNTPIYNLIVELDFLFMRYTNYHNEKKEQILLSTKEWIERLNEFEVIKNIDELDLISMNSLFDFYKQPFGSYEIQRIKFNSKGYKIIE